MKSLREIFVRFDEGAKGYLNPHELRCCVIYLTGVRISKVAMSRLKEAKKEFTLIDLNNVANSQNREDYASEVFHALEPENKGYITLQDFNDLCDVHAKHMKSELREAVFQEVDSNKDGMVTLRDIQRLVKFNIE